MGKENAKTIFPELPGGALLFDGHIHTCWSDGKMSLPEVIDWYGENHFDAIAITDHVCRKYDPLIKFGRAIRLCNVITEKNFPDYLSAIKSEAERAWAKFKMIVIPGIEVTRQSLRAKKRAHIIALDIKKFISASQSPKKILEEIKKQGAVSIACHPHCCERHLFQTLYLWKHRSSLSHLIDLWEIASRNELLNLIYLNNNPLPYLAGSDFHKKEHIYGWKTILFCEKNIEAIKNCLKENKNIGFTLFKKETEIN